MRGRARASGTQRARATVATAEARVRIRVRTFTQGRERSWLRLGFGLGSGLGSILTGRERVWRRAAQERRERAVGWQRGGVKHRRARRARARARGARGGARGGGGVRATGGAREGGAACWRAYVGGAVGVGTHRIARQRDDALDEESARIEHALAGVRGRGRLGVG